MALLQNETRFCRTKSKNLQLDEQTAQGYSQRMRSFIPLILCAGVVGCGNGGDDGPCATVAREGYPAGPFGEKPGATIADLELVADDGSPFFLNQIHADGDNQLLLLGSSSGWCSACIEEQPALQDLHERYRDKCLYIMVTLFEDADFNPANAALAASWKEQYDVSFEVVADPNYLLEPYYAADQPPMHLWIDVATREVLEVITGWDGAVIESLIEAHR